MDSVHAASRSLFVFNVNALVAFTSWDCLNHELPKCCLEGMPCHLLALLALIPLPALIVLLVSRELPAGVVLLPVLPVLLTTTALLTHCAAGPRNTASTTGTTSAGTTTSTRTATASGATDSTSTTP